MSSDNNLRQQLEFSYGRKLFESKENGVEAIALTSNEFQWF